MEKPRTILFVSKGTDAASTRYRSLAFFERLEAVGWRPIHKTAPNRWGAWRRLIEMASQVDVVVVLRRLPGLRVRRALRRNVRFLVVDLDDAIFRGQGESPSARRARRFRAMARSANEVWAGNDYLADYARRHNPNTFVLPTAIDPDAYNVRTERATDGLDLVWIGSTSTRCYLVEILPQLEALAESVPGVRLRVVADFQLTGQRIEVIPIPWSQAVEAEALATSHIGLAPMPDTGWTRGKCGCKVLQYMAARLPVVASDMPIHRSQIIDGQTGLLVANSSGWVEAIKKLADDSALQQKMGQAGRLLLEQRFSIDVVWQQMLRRLEQAVNNPG